MRVKCTGQENLYYRVRWTCAESSAISTHTIPVLRAERTSNMLGWMSSTTFRDHQGLDRLCERLHHKMHLWILTRCGLSY